MSKPPIFVTQPSLPPLDELIPYLKKIWESKILTNGGPFHQELEDALCEYLDVPYISLFSNGTIALITIHGLPSYQEPSGDVSGCKSLCSECQHTFSHIRGQRPPRVRVADAWLHVLLCCCVSLNNGDE